MTVKDLLARNRSFRRFHQEPLEASLLTELVELTRLCPSAANRQPLKYMITYTPRDNGKVFKHLAWAGALRDWPGPAEGERPTGYVIILGDTQITKNFHVDPGIVAQSMLLGAVEHGLGGCMVGSINRNALRDDFHIPERFEILLVVALGKPSEKVVLEDTASPDQIDYWRDADDVHHVPKRPMQELLVRFD